MGSKSKVTVFWSFTDATSVIRHESGTWVSYGQQFEQGHPIRMRCVVGSSSEEEWSFRWYRVVSYRDGLLDAPRWSQTDTRYSLEPLSDSSSRKSDGFYTLNSAAPAHSGLYVCRAEKEEPVLHVYSTPTFVWVKGWSGNCRFGNFVSRCVVFSPLCRCLPGCRQMNRFHLAPLVIH